MIVAIEGCAHGELDMIYQCIESYSKREGNSVDLLICCGDFQAVRNKSDLCTMAVPQKYQRMGSFYKYYSGEKIAPILTIFIGGNHEASNYLQELPFGGWVAPNIFYMGRAGVVNFGDLRIGGLSGIYKYHDYQRGLWECVPYNQGSLRSVYHIRSLDVFRLSQLKDNLHAMLSHDWPQGVTDYGDVENLLMRKPFFRDDITSGRLGSAPAEELLHTLKPDSWFSAHLHCKFTANVTHGPEYKKQTSFLALDKCLPKRRHFQVLKLPAEHDGDKCLKYDAEWLAILKSTNHLLSVKEVNLQLPVPGGQERYEFAVTEAEKEAVIKLMGSMKIHDNPFVKTAPVYDPRDPKRPPTEPYFNPQTGKLCKLLGIDDPIEVIMAHAGKSMKQPEHADKSMNIPEDAGKSMKQPELVEPVVRQISKMNLPQPAMNGEGDQIAFQLEASENSKLSDMSFVTDTEPATPGGSEAGNFSQEMLTPGCNTTNDSFNTTDEFSTPTSQTKRTFKRRNMSMYDTSIEDVASSSDLNDTEGTPCKLPFSK